jgi:hypothetical protein
MLPLIGTKRHAAKSDLVRYGSIASVCRSASHSRSTPSTNIARSARFVRFVPEADLKAATRMLQSEDRGLSYSTSAIFGPDESICALVAEGRFDGNAGSGDRKAASGGAPWDGRRAAVAGSTITFAPTFTRS